MNKLHELSKRLAALKKVQCLDPEKWEELAKDFDDAGYKFFAKVNRERAKYCREVKIGVRKIGQL